MPTPAPIACPDVASAIVADLVAAEQKFLAGQPLQALELLRASITQLGGAPAASERLAEWEDLYRAAEDQPSQAEPDIRRIIALGRAVAAASYRSFNMQAGQSPYVSFYFQHAGQVRSVLEQFDI